MRCSLARFQPFTWREGLFEFLSLFSVLDDQCVKVPAASDFELHIILILLDLDS
jgi:hypothetical protein